MRISRLLLIIAAVALCVSCSDKKEKQEVIPLVKTQVVGDAASTLVHEFPGRVKASKDVGVSFKVAGTIQKILLKEGDSFRKGQVLAIMDPKDYQLQFNAAKAQYEQVKAQANRVINLYADSVVSADKYDQARYGLEQVTAKYEFAKNQLEDCKLVAPFDGFVNKRYFESGTTVAAGMPVLSIISGGVPEVEIEIPAKVLDMKSNFASFTAKFDYSEEPVSLRLISISPKANSNQLYPIRLSIDSKDGKYPTPGMNTMVKVNFKSDNFEQYSIPSTALFSEAGDDRTYVWLISADNVVVRKREVIVSTLHTNGTADISLGLESGNVVITAGVHQLHEGQKVQVLKETSPTNVGSLL
ncbi:MAG: efflux RND transporter periplasmic adaptor subunit [Bacteroidales bacterium]|nr:efflux RND transporter periplasmic adaptor subunit [Bacteroidales bacterium]